MFDNDDPIEVGARYKITDPDSEYMGETLTVTNIRVSTPGSHMDVPSVDVEYDSDDVSIKAEKVALSDFRTRIRKGFVIRVNNSHNAGKRRADIETGERDSPPSDTQKLKDVFA